MNTIKVYKTTVNDKSEAESIKEDICRDMPGSTPSFDLEDHDKVLRVENSSDSIDESVLRQILRNYGYTMSKLL